MQRWHHNVIFNRNILCALFQLRYVSHIVAAQTGGVARGSRSARYNPCEIIVLCLYNSVGDNARIRRIDKQYYKSFPVLDSYIIVITFELLHLFSTSRVHCAFLMDHLTAQMGAYFSDSQMKASKTTTKIGFIYISL